MRRAGRTIAESLKLYFGTYRERIIQRPLAEPIEGMPRYVRVLNSEEKGTDVNLTTRLLVDGFEGSYEQAVVVTNDSDFVNPVRFVRERLKLKIMIINPDESRKHAECPEIGGDRHQAVKEKPSAPKSVANDD